LIEIRLGLQGCAPGFIAGGVSLYNTITPTIVDCLYLVLDL
jgi:hypothetical protein